MRAGAAPWPGWPTPPWLPWRPSVPVPPTLSPASGPAIGPDRYQVGEEVAQAVRECFGERAPLVIRPDGTGRWLCDLWSANRLLLREAGVADHRIHVAAVPTGADFFSNRAARPCGRFGVLARLRPRDGGAPR